MYIYKQSSYREIKMIYACINVYVYKCKDMYISASSMNVMQKFQISHVGYIHWNPIHKNNSEKYIFKGLWSVVAPKSIFFSISKTWKIVFFVKKQEVEFSSIFQNG